MSDFKAKMCQIRFPTQLIQPQVVFKAIKESATLLLRGGKRKGKGGELPLQLGALDLAAEEGREGEVGYCRLSHLH